MENAVSPGISPLTPYIPARYGRGDAEVFFTRPGWGRLFGLLGRSALPARNPEPGRITLPRLERIWMPWFAVEFATETRARLNAVSVAVDAWSGMVVLFERADAIEESLLDEPIFPPPFDTPHAVEIARNGLFQVILRRRGQLNKPIIKEARSARLFYMPLWLYYYRRVLGHIDIRLMDAYTGQASGGRIRNGVLNAIVGRREEESPETP